MGHAQQCLGILKISKLMLRTPKYDHTFATVPLFKYKGSYIHYHSKVWGNLF